MEMINSCLKLKNRRKEKGQVFTFPFETEGCALGPVSSA